MTERLLVLYIPGLDARRIVPEHTPYLAELRASCPWATICTYPSPELLSTVVTGLNPHEHGIWQATLVPRRARSLAERLIDALPDAVTTTAQCVRHQLFHDCDVPTIPPRRRRRFAFHRLKFHGRADTQQLLARLGDVPSIVSLLGANRCRYRFTDRFHDRDALLREAASGRWDLEIVQFHAMDMLGHWFLDTPEKLRAYYRATDDFVRQIHARCRANGLRLAILSDHGQERITGAIDLRRELRQLRLRQDEYAYYLQPITARFWFETDRAREAVTGLLRRLPHGTCHTYRELAEFGVHFPDGRFGEVYFLAAPGYQFFPHDFHHGLTNLVFGLKDWQQRSRIRSGKHIAYHGYLPTYESEQGWMVLAEAGYRVEAPRIDLIDLVPSWLALLGEPVPPALRGRPRFYAS